jgi:Zn-finger nucleic acid-binding protein
LLSNDTEIDFCKSCKGLWFDDKELEGIRPQDTTLQAILKTTIVPLSPLECKSCGFIQRRTTKKCTACRNPLLLPCPGCGKNLQETQVGTLYADRCTSCRGVWLDGGELELLFSEFQKIRALQDSRKPSRVWNARGPLDGVGDLTLHSLIWAPDLLFHAAAATAEIAKNLPNLAEGALDAAGSIPAVAGKAVEVSGELISGAIDLTGKVPEAAAGLGDLLASFLELILGLFSD